MPQPTKAELQSKFNALQQDYKTKLDDIFDRLYKRLEDFVSRLYNKQVSTFIS